MHPSPAWGRGGRGGGVKNFRKNLARDVVRNFNFGGGGGGGGGGRGRGGSRNFEVKIKTA